MIEFSYTEMVLFVWAIVATGYAMKFKQEAAMFQMLLFKAVAEPETYARMREGWKKAQLGG